MTFTTTAPRMTSRVNITRFPVPNRHITGQGHHRTPQKTQTDK